MFTIKQIPEDFVVEEIPNRVFREDGKYLILKVQKTERNTEDVALQIARQLKRQRKDVGYAGLKDKQAVTTQYFSVKDARKNSLDWISIDKVKVSFVGYSNEPIALGNLQGNKFTITVRNIDRLPQMQRYFPNSFDEQRFSKHNDDIGKALVQRNFANACMLIHSPTIDQALAARPNDVVGALRTVPRKLLTLYVHAYQSRLFNKVLDRLLGKLSIDVLRSSFIPIVGFGTEDLELYEEVLAEEHISPRDFIIRELPDLSAEGGERQAVLELETIGMGPLEEDELNPGKKKTVLTFTLPKGAYATNVVKWLCRDL